VSLEFSGLAQASAPPAVVSGARAQVLKSVVLELGQLHERIAG
jgi:hypothetical protein